MMTDMAMADRAAHRVQGSRRATRDRRLRHRLLVAQLRPRSSRSTSSRSTSRSSTVWPTSRRRRRSSRRSSSWRGCSVCERSPKAWRRPTSSATCATCSCELGQGFLFAKPLNGLGLRQVLKSRREGAPLGDRPGRHIHPHCAEGANALSRKTRAHATGRPAENPPPGPLPHSRQLPGTPRAEHGPRRARGFPHASAIAGVPFAHPAPRRLQAAPPDQRHVAGLVELGRLRSRPAQGLAPDDGRGHRRAARAPDPRRRPVARRLRVVQLPRLRSRRGDHRQGARAPCAVGHPPVLVAPARQPAPLPRDRRADDRPPRLRGRAVAPDDHADPLVGHPDPRRARHDLPRRPRAQDDLRRLPVRDEPRRVDAALPARRLGTPRGAAARERPQAAAPRSFSTA